MTMEKKVIAVMGATDVQGGSVVKAFHTNKDISQVRAITRDPTTSNAKDLDGIVKEVVKADGDNEESMVKAFEGCYGAFIVSNFWEDLDVRHEMNMLRTVKNAAEKADLKHIVLSTLEDTRKYVNKADNTDTWKVLEEELQMYVPHLDGKGELIQNMTIYLQLSFSQVLL